MYHIACKVEFQPFNRLYSQLTLFNFYKMLCVSPFDKIQEIQISSRCKVCATGIYAKVAKMSINP